MQNATPIALAFTGQRSWQNGIAAATSAGLTAAAGLALMVGSGRIELVATLLLLTTCAGAFTHRLDGAAHAAGRSAAEPLRPQSTTFWRTVGDEAPGVPR